MLGKPSSHISGLTILKCIRMQKTQMYHVAQELYASILALHNVDMHSYAKFNQNLPRGSRTNC